MPRGKKQRQPEEPEVSSSEEYEEEEGGGLSSDTDTGSERAAAGTAAAAAAAEDRQARGDSKADQGGSPAQACSTPKQVGRKRRCNKRPRLSWTPELHRKFVTAVEKLGGPWSATPKAILESMGSDGLNLANIKSHLQKFRLKASKLSKMEQERTAAEAGMLAALNGAGAAAGGGGSGVGGVLPGMVPVTAVGSGTSGPMLLRNTMPPGALQPAAANDVTTAFQVLAAARQQQDLAFADAFLGAQATQWRRRQQQVQTQLSAMLAMLQQQHQRQQQEQQDSIAGASAGSPALSASAAGVQQLRQRQRLARLQQENLNCLKALYSCHALQMQRHLDMTACLRGSAAGRVGQEEGKEAVAARAREQQQQVVFVEVKEEPSTLPTLLAEEVLASLQCGTGKKAAVSEQ